MEYCKNCKHSYQTTWKARACKKEKMLVADHGKCKNFEKKQDKGESNV